MFTKSWSDNAAIEGFFGRLKVEFFYGRDWSGWTAEEFGTVKILAHFPTAP